MPVQEFRARPRKPTVETLNPRLSPEDLGSSQASCGIVFGGLLIKGRTLQG